MNENEMHEIYEMAINDLNEYASIILGYSKDRKFLHNYCNMSERARNGLVHIMLKDPEIFEFVAKLLALLHDVFNRAVILKNEEEGGTKH